MYFLQVELMIAEAETYPGSDEVVLHAKRMRKKSSVGQQRKSTVMPALLEDSQDANAELDASQVSQPLSNPYTFRTPLSRA